ncbi:MAG: hypothetical protein ACRC2T_19505, partial [Thermoguttaceae bacterium]
LIPNEGAAKVTPKGIESSIEVIIAFQDDDPNVSVQNVMLYDILPPPGSVYNYRGWLDYRYVATNLKAAMTTHRNVTNWWEVTITYEHIGAPVGALPPSPTDFFGGVTVRRYIEIVQQVATRDWAGKPVLNSAGQLFDPPFQINRGRRGYIISRKEYVNPCVKADSHEYCVNSTIFWGFPPDTVLCKRIDVTANLTGEIYKPAWDVTYDICIDNRIHGYDKDNKPIIGHNMAILDNGRYELKEETTGEGDQQVTKTKLVPITINGVEVDSPVRLDGKGKRLKNGPSVYVPGMPFASSDLNELCLPNPYFL